MTRQRLCILMHPLNQITLMCTQLCIKALHLFNNDVIFFCYSRWKMAGFSRVIALSKFFTTYLTVVILLRIIYKILYSTIHIGMEIHCLCHLWTVNGKNNRESRYLSSSVIFHLHVTAIDSWMHNQSYVDMTH